MIQQRTSKDVLVLDASPLLLVAANEFEFGMPSDTLNGVSQLEPQIEECLLEATVTEEKIMVRIRTDSNP